MIYRIDPLLCASSLVPFRLICSVVARKTKFEGGQKEIATTPPRVPCLTPWFPLSPPSRARAMRPVLCSRAAVPCIPVSDWRRCCHRCGPRGKADRGCRGPIRREADGVKIQGQGRAQASGKSPLHVPSLTPVWCSGNQTARHSQARTAHAACRAYQYGV